MFDSFPNSFSVNCVMMPVYPTRSPKRKYRENLTVRYRDIWTGNKNPRFRRDRIAPNHKTLTEKTSKTVKRMKKRTMTRWKQQWKQNMKSYKTNSNFLQIQLTTTFCPGIFSPVSSKRKTVVTRLEFTFVDPLLDILI